MTNQTTTSPIHDQIRARAYFLWEQAGKPVGRDQEFWFRAEADLQKLKRPAQKPLPAPLAASGTPSAGGSSSARMEGVQGPSSAKPAPKGRGRRKAQML